MTTPGPVPPASQHVETNVGLQAGDVELIGDLYLPQGDGPFPALFEITPYRARNLANLGQIYAGRGFLFLAVDARGRYRSGGEFEPLAHDQVDGHAVIRWLAAHPLCNGRIGSRGHSYSGYNQLLTAIDAPGQLQACVACVAPGDPFVNVPFAGGAYDIGDLLWLLGMTGRVCADESPGEDFGVFRFGTSDTASNPYAAEATEAQATHAERSDAQTVAHWSEALCARPFREVDVRLGVRHEIFRQWLRHWRLDEFWRLRSVGSRVSRIKAPVLLITGWWDSNGRGASQFYSGLRECGRERRLLIGPWDHGLNVPEVGALPADEAARIERAAEHDELNDEFAWFDQHLRDAPAGPATGARVSLFVTGVCRWLGFDDWPPEQTVTQSFYLDRGPSEGAGGLSRERPNASASWAYTFDPADPTPFASRPMQCEPAPFDAAGLADERSDILVFESPVLEAPLALIGECSALLYAEADAPDFDLCVKLLDHYPDGQLIYLADGILRARFRGGWEQPEPVEPGVVEPYQIDLWHLGHVLRPGHTLRVEVASAAFPRFDVNPCTGGDLATQTRSQPVQVRLHQSSRYPSQLLLPRCDDPRLTGQTMP